MSGTSIVAAHVLYVATTATFGCTSDQEVLKLSQIRSTTQLFERELYDQVFLGQCVIIGKGTTIEGSERQSDAATILVDRNLIPPGYLAPSADFERMKDNRK